jgi:hypothetical protein
VSRVPGKEWLGYILQKGTKHLVLYSEELFFPGTRFFVAALLRMTLAM